VNVKSTGVAGGTACVIGNHHGEQRTIIGTSSGRSGVRGRSRAIDYRSVLQPLVAERIGARRCYRESRCLPDYDILAHRLRRDRRGLRIVTIIGSRACQTRADCKREGTHQNNPKHCQATKITQAINRASILLGTAIITTDIVSRRQLFNPCAHALCFSFIRYFLGKNTRFT
jgi:hypothetical protein